MYYGIIFSLVTTTIGTIAWVFIIVAVIKAIKGSRSNSTADLTNHDISVKLLAYEEVYNKCKTMSDSGVVTYFSLDDIRTIVDKLEEF